MIPSILTTHLDLFSNYPPQTGLCPQTGRLPPPSPPYNSLYSVTVETSFIILFSCQARVFNFFFAFYDLIFLAIILSDIDIRINTEGFSFIWLILASTFVAGVLPALMLLYSLIKALVGNK